jgi:hypothetical protein
VPPELILAASPGVGARAPGSRGPAHEDLGAGSRRRAAQEDLSRDESTEGGRDGEVADRARGTAGEVEDEAGIFLSKKS